MKSYIRSSGGTTELNRGRMFNSAKVFFLGLGQLFHLLLRNLLLSIFTRCFVKLGDSIFDMKTLVEI